MLFVLFKARWGSNEVLGFFFVDKDGKIDSNPTRVEPGMGYNKIIKGGNGIGVTRSKPTPLPSLGGVV